ncbi:hypothetical protein JW711_04910 [Candidatus Woesearchaeota archaeon]|nr:hypothetical protein [Candidatus Woesearchaeota archaeon]
MKRVSQDRKFLTLDDLQDKFQKGDGLEIILKYGVEREFDPHSNMEVYKGFGQGGLSYHKPGTSIMGYLFNTVPDNKGHVDASMLLLTGSKRSDTRPGVVMAQSSVYGVRAYSIYSIRKVK